MHARSARVAHYVRFIQSIPYAEDETTAQLLKKLSHVRRTGYLTKKELLLILQWKSPRPIQHYSLNTSSQIKSLTMAAFSLKDDCHKLHLLTALEGVNYPTASAILMFYHPKKFPVLDIRVWKQLYAAGLVDVNPSGQHFSLRQCRLYYAILRNIARSLHLNVRALEKKIFDFDKMVQFEPLYRKI